MLRTFVATGAVFLLVGCYSGEATSGTLSGDGPDGSDGSASSLAQGDAGAGGTAPPSAGGPATGIPCDVQQLLAKSCLRCHGSPPSSGAPMPLVTYEDLVAPAKSNPARLVVEVAIDRMQSTTSAMPPGARLPASDVAILQSWLASGHPRSSCGAPAAVDAGPSPYDTPTVCTSATVWTQGDRKSPLMHPGGACITCHSTQNGPDLAAGGTVFPTAHEPTDCSGSNAGGAVVKIIDASGVVFTMPVNEAGNFYAMADSLRAAIVPPYRASVSANGRERAMPVPQTNTDCNACHTEAGTKGAPGRVMLP